MHTLPKRLLPLLACLALTACTSADSTASTPATGSQAPASPAGEAEVYYLNFKPEVASVYADIAAAYHAETGIKVNVVTAAAGGYEQQLKSELAKKDAPTIFQINGPRGYAAWKDYCADLTDSKLYAALTDQSLAVTGPDGKVYGIPNVVEGYGIIVNTEIMDRYFALGTSPVASTAEITSFEILKAVVEDMTAHKDELNIRGVFASTSLSPGEDWRWHTHLANVPLHAEWRANGTPLTSGVPEISFIYRDNMRALFDLYLSNSVTAPGLLGSRQVTDSMAEFALGQCAMVQNGNWAWSQIADIEGNTVSGDKLMFLPLYMGLPDEARQGLCIGTENYLAINSKASPEAQKASLDFLWWLYSSDTGRRFVTEELRFLAPFTTFTASERPDDPLAREVLSWMERDDRENIPWSFTLFPSQHFKDDFGASLLAYAQGKIDWSELAATAESRWNEERQ